MLQRKAISLPWGDLVKARKNTENVVIYLSTAPKFFAQACENLAEIGLNADNGARGFGKPLGTDLASSQQINTDVPVISKKSKSTVSTIIWVKKACKTCWPCVLPM